MFVNNLKIIYSMYIMNTVSLSTSDIISNTTDSLDITNTSLQSSTDTIFSSLESTLESTLDDTLENPGDTILGLDKKTKKTNNKYEYTRDKDDISVDISIDVNENKQSNECVICLEGGNIILNPLCDCKFYFHEQCYSNWLFDNERLCIFCKKDLTNKVDILLFHEDEHGILTEYDMYEKNSIIHKSIPVSRSRTAPAYSTNRIRDANIFVIEENIDNDNDNIDRDDDNHSSPNICVRIFGSSRRRAGLCMTGTISLIIYMFYEIFVNM